MLNFHIENKGDITIATIPVNEKDAPGFGILKSDEQNNITAFIEKPVRIYCHNGARMLMR